MRSRWLRHLRNVVLPEPDGPIMTTTSRGRTSIETPLRTARSPKRLTTPRADITADGSAFVIGFISVRSLPGEGVPVPAEAGTGEARAQRRRRDDVAGVGEFPFDEPLDEGPDRGQGEVVA